MLGNQCNFAWFEFEAIHQFHVYIYTVLDFILFKAIQICHIFPNMIQLPRHPAHPHVLFLRVDSFCFNDSSPKKRRFVGKVQATCSRIR